MLIQPKHLKQYQQSSFVPSSSLFMTQISPQESHERRLMPALPPTQAQTCLPISQPLQDADRCSRDRKLASIALFFGGVHAPDPAAAPPAPAVPVPVPDPTAATSAPPSVGAPCTDCTWAWGAVLYKLQWSPVGRCVM